MKKGIIYICINAVIENIKYFNLVELPKYIFKKFFFSDSITATRFAVDLFIILKWTFVMLLWYFNVKNQVINIAIFYLIFTNIYTYFYYHVWTKDLENPFYDSERIKRRFLKLMLSIAFNVVAFAYLIAQPFSNNFKWKNGYSELNDALFFSISNSLTTSYQNVSIITELGHSLSLIETVTSFIFLTIILANSIPQMKE
jgi:hypothetical protein